MNKSQVGEEDMKMVKNILLSIVAIGSLLSAGGDIAQRTLEPAAVANPWQFEAQVYMLAPWIEGPTEVGYRYRLLGIGKLREDSIDKKMEMSPKDVFDALKMGFMGHFDVRYQNRWGIWLDYAFMNLGKSDKLPFDRTTGVHMGFYQGVFEGFVTYREPLAKGFVDYYGGVRWWHNEVTFSLDQKRFPLMKLEELDRDIDWYDPVIGVKWTYPLNESWDLTLRGDIGGFGISDSSSDFSAVVEIGALYSITPQWQMRLSFKSMWVDYTEGTAGKADRFVYDTVSYGPIIGVIYRF